MDKLLRRLNAWFEQIPGTTIKYKRWVWSLFIIGSIVLIGGVPRIKMDMSMEAYFVEDDPVKQAYDRFRATFGSDETIYMVYKPKDGDVFSVESLSTLSKIQDELLNYRLHLKPGEKSELDHITDVKSLINVSYMEARQGTLYSRKFIGQLIPKTQEEREALRKQALIHPDYPLIYFSKDSQYGGFFIQTDLGATVEEDIIIGDNQSPTELPPSNTLPADPSLDEEELSFDLGEMEIEISEVIDIPLKDKGPPKFKKAEMGDYVNIMNAIEAIVYKKEYTDILEFHPVGGAPMMKFFMENMLEEMSYVSGGAIVLIFIILLILFRSFSAVVWPLIIIAVSCLWSLGIAGWLGITMTTMMNVMIFLILAVGVADTVHILSGYIFFKNQGLEHHAALSSVFKKSGLACFLTSITTGIGMMALTFVPIVPIRIFGIFSALGVFFAFVFTVFLLPVMIDFWGPHKKETETGKAARPVKEHFILSILKKFEYLSYGYPKQIFTIFIIIGCVLFYGISKVRIDSNLMELLKDSTALKQDYLLTDEHMGGSQGMELLVDTGKPGGLKDPKILNLIEDLENHMMKKYSHLVTKTSSLVNVTKDSFKTMHDGDSEKYIIPQDPALLDQTLFMFNNANPKDRRLLVSDDYSQSRVTITLKNAGSEKYEKIIEEVDVYIASLIRPLLKEYPALKIKLTGAMSLMMTLSQYISRSQIQSFGLALVVISFLLVIFFASKRVGAMAIFPNIFPILTAFGVMGYFDIALDSDTLLVAPIIIGIAVDDTIHFLTHYRLEMLKHNNIVESIKQAYREAGQAIAFTSVVLAVGFMIFIFSSHLGLRNFGFISALSITTALIADLLLLPSMCILFKANFGNGNKETGSTN